jgi:hypothetical protein
MLLASGFPGFAWVFTASLPGLSGLHITPSPSSALRAVIQAAKLIIHNQVHVEKLVNSNQPHIIILN